MKPYRYTTLLFDADDTLLDFKASERDALSYLFSELNVPLTKDVAAYYHEVNHGLWKAFERGEVSRDEVLHSRFVTVFKTLQEKGIAPKELIFGNKVITATELEPLYQAKLAAGHHLIAGAKEMIESLRKTHRVYIVSNGVATTQESRLNASGLYPLFEGIFISEMTGYQKPQVEFFDYCMERIPNFSKESTLIIGDSLTSDIKGGNNIGIDTCWFNADRLQNNQGVHVTHEIHTLEDLYKIVS